MPDDYDFFTSPKRIAEALDLPAARIRDAIRRGELRAVELKNLKQPGRPVYALRMAWVDDWLDSLPFVKTPKTKKSKSSKPGTLTFRPRGRSRRR